MTFLLKENTSEEQERDVFQLNDWKISNILPGEHVHPGFCSWFIFEWEALLHQSVLHDNKEFQLLMHLAIYTDAECKLWKHFYWPEAAQQGEHFDAKWTKIVMGNLRVKCWDVTGPGKCQPPGCGTCHVHWKGQVNSLARSDGVVQAQHQLETFAHWWFTANWDTWWTLHSTQHAIWCTDCHMADSIATFLTDSNLIVFGLQNLFASTHARNKTNPCRTPQSCAISVIDINVCCWVLWQSEKQESETCRWKSGRTVLSQEMTFLLCWKAKQKSGQFPIRHFLDFRCLNPKHWWKV